MQDCSVAEIGWIVYYIRRVLPGLDFHNGREDSARSEHRSCCADKSHKGLPLQQNICFSIREVNALLI